MHAKRFSARACLLLLLAFVAVCKGRPTPPDSDCRSSETCKSFGYCKQGDEVMATWAGNNQAYAATLANVQMLANGLQVATVNWADGDDRHRLVALEHVTKAGIPCDALRDDAHGVFDDLAGATAGGDTAGGDKAGGDKASGAGWGDFRLGDFAVPESMRQFVGQLGLDLADGAFSPPTLDAAFLRDAKARLGKAAAEGGHSAAARATEAAASVQEALDAAATHMRPAMNAAGQALGAAATHPATMRLREGMRPAMNAAGQALDAAATHMRPAMNAAGQALDAAATHMRPAMNAAGQALDSAAGRLRSAAAATPLGDIDTDGTRLAAAGLTGLAGLAVGVPYVPGVTDNIAVGIVGAFAAHKVATPASTTPAADDDDDTAAAAAAAAADVDTSSLAAVRCLAEQHREGQPMAWCGASGSCRELEELAFELPEACASGWEVATDDTVRSAEQQQRERQQGELKRVGRRGEKKHGGEQGEQGERGAQGEPTAATAASAASATKRAQRTQQSSQSERTACLPGDAVEAIWRGNNGWHTGHIAQVNFAAGTATMDWAGGNTSHRVVALSHVLKGGVRCAMSVG